MKLTVLELTQDILSSLDSDEVNSIGDTTEAQQVAKCIRAAYFNILARADLPEHRQLFSIDASGSSSQPVLMTVPTNVSRIDWVKYNTSDDTTDEFNYVTILPLQQFLDMTHMLREDETFVDTMTLNGQTFYFRNEKMPEYCTIIEDTNVVFDSYDNEEDSTLQTSKTLCFGIVVPTFELSDSHEPDIDEQQFPLLLNEAKSLAFLELKQMPHEKAELEARRQWRTLQRTKSQAQRPSWFDQLPNFGRK